MWRQHLWQGKILLWLWHPLPSHRHNPNDKARWKKFNIFDWWVKKCFWSNNNTSIGVLEAIFKEFFLTPNSLKVNNHDSKHLRFNLRWNFRWGLFRWYGAIKYCRVDIWHATFKTQPLKVYVLRVTVKHLFAHFCALWNQQLHESHAMDFPV